MFVEKKNAPQSMFEGVARRVKRRGASLAFVVALGAFAGTLGCRVNSDDLKRWENTVNGPEKLVAVLTHDKYEKELRVEAAWSLIEMKKRSGQSVGLTRLLDELEKLDAKDRKDIVAGIWKRLEAKVLGGLQKTDKGMADPTVTFKDATFAIYTDDKLDLDSGIRDSMTKALTEWAIGKEGEKPEERLALMEARMDNAAQAYGVEQILRRLGLPAAKKLPVLLSATTAIKSQKLDSFARILNDVKSPSKSDDKSVDKVKEEASEQFAKILEGTLGDGYLKAVEAETKDALKASPQGKGVLDNPEQYKKYMDKVRDERLQWLFPVVKQVGKKPIVGKLMELAKNDKETKEHRALGLAALEGNVDTSSDSQLKDFLAIAKSSAPDEVKSGALGRIGAYPPDQAVRAYYELFDSPTWKVRFDGAMSVLAQMNKIGDKAKTTPKEFLSKLPAKGGGEKGEKPSDKDLKMGLGEPSSYGTELGKLKPEMGAKAAIADALTGRNLGAQLTALGWYLANGTKDDLGMLQKYADSKEPVFKCKDDDDCGWDKPGCPIPKAGAPNEVEYKSIATVGDYVNYCVKPEIERRAKAAAEEKK